MYALLFSFGGRIGRLKFFLSSMFVAIITTICIAIVICTPIYDALVLHGENIKFSHIKLDAIDIVVTLLFFATGVWIELSLIWKRTRDMNEGLAFAYVYVGLWLLSWVPIFGLFFATLNMMMLLYLLFKPSKDNGRKATNSEILKRPPPIDGGQEEAVAGFGETLTDADLVARATQLREAQCPPPTASDMPSENTAVTGPKTFGRRSRLQPG